MVPLAADTPSPFLLNNDEEGAERHAAQRLVPLRLPATAMLRVLPGTGANAATSATGAISKPRPGGRRFAHRESGFERHCHARLVDIPLPADRYGKVEALDGRLLLLVNAEPGRASQPDASIRLHRIRSEKEAKRAR